VPIPIQLLNALSIIPMVFRGHTTGLLTTRTYNTGLTTPKIQHKEFVEMHGLDKYDYGVRGYYPAMGRFQMPVPEI